MPPCHQRGAVREDAGGGHVANCATDTDICPNRGRFALRVSKRPLWETVHVTVRTAPVELPGLAPTPGRPFGIYIHVPFCATRCGYCDFNTYTPAELGGANPDGWLVALRAELGQAADLLGSPAQSDVAGRAAPEVQTVFVGGGTPSLLGGEGLTGVLDAVREHFVLAPGAEVTTEANPESTSPELFAQLRAAGYTRVSLGMQSVAPHVLATLDRVHSPGRAPAAAREALAAGFEHVNIDLIYGTPGESDDDLRRSVDAAVEGGVDHISAYALTVEEGTAMARRVRRGEIPPTDDDVLAHRYELGRRAAAGGRLRLVRGLQLEPTRRRVQAQHGLLGRRRVVGRRAGSARLRRVDAVVEYQASQRICANVGRRSAAGSRFRGALRRGDTHRGRDAAAAAATRPADRRAERS